jgi:hypothetical protein
MTRTPATIAICKYTVKAGKEAEFAKIFAGHYPTMLKLGLVAQEPHLLFRGSDHKTKKPLFVEILPWKDEEASGRAHRMPEVMAVWERMGALCESIEFPNLAPFSPEDADH